jgi:transaldolase
LTSSAEGARALWWRVDRPNLFIKIPAARQVLGRLRALGVDYHEVTMRLEEQGLETFDASWRELSDRLAAALRSPLRGPRENHQAQQEART